ncbi:MAG: M1 family metallopeptidase [Deltaproteobacteria bacterium]|nr:M1 family metallopeptidase [Deltaproteobacteria bacterium]
MRIPRSLTALLLTTLASTGCATLGLPEAELAALPHRLPATAAPTRYTIEWRIDPAKTEFSGRVEIDLELTGATEHLRFHAEGMKLRAPHFLVDASVEPSGRIEARLQAVPAAEGRPVDQWLALPARPLPAGAATLVLDFEAPFDTRLTGLYRVEREGQAHVYTQLEPAYARKAFPCLDEPGFKTPFAITVISPAGLEIHSNAPVERVEAQGEVQRVVFRETPPLPTYLVALVVGELETVRTSVGELPLTGLAAKGKGARLKEALATHAELLPRLEAYFGIAYPYAKLDLAALLEFAAGAMENAGLIVYREELLLSDPESRSLGAEERIGSVAAHELAHQWFGNLVTMAWWDDLWLNEAFATWMAAKIVDGWRPEYEQGLDLLAGRNQVFHSDSLAAARAVRQPVQSVAEAEAAFDGLTYVKGGSILSMLEAWLGPELFQAGIQRYLQEHAWRTATADDLFAALEAVSEEPVERVARSFLDRPGVPLLETELRCGEDAGVRLRLVQRPYQALGGAKIDGGGEPWVLPLCVAWPERESLTRQCLLLEEAEQEVVLATEQCPRWVHPNAGEHGYFRWQAPAGQLSEMARWLEGKDAPELRRMRVSLLDQAWGAVAAGALDPAEGLALIELAGASEDPRLQRMAAGKVAGVADLWPDLAETPAYRAFADRVLGARARALGWRPAEGERRAHTLMRGSLLWTLGRHGSDAGVKEGAAAQARLYLEDPTKVSADVAGTALRLARREGAVTQDELLSALEKASGSQERLTLLSGLGAAPAGEELDAALALAFDPRVRAQDVWYLFGGGFDGKERTARTFAFLKENYDELQARLPSFAGRSAARLARLVGAFCDEEGRDAAIAFFQEKDAPGHERYLALGKESADRCIAQQAKGRASAEAYLKRTLSSGSTPAG